MILNVLIVHDKITNLTQIVSTIKEIESSIKINILTASEIDKAIEITKNNDIQLIILDTNTDDVAYLDIVEQLKKNKYTKNIYIIFLLDIFNPKVFIDNGYCIEDIDYLIKPIDKYQFLNKISIYLKLLSSQKELQEYKKVIDYAAIVSRSDSKGNITYANDKFCEISGYTREELLGKPHSILRSSNMSKDTFKDLWETVQSKNNWEGIVENRAKNGSSYFVNAVIMPILDFKNEIVEYISVREDITELKKLQLDELGSSIDKALEINWKNTIESIPIASVIIDEDSKIKFSNILFQEIFTYENEKVLSECFVEKENYVYEDIIFDWKDIILNSDSKEKVLINLNEEELEFEINIKKIDSQDLYVVCFNLIENII